MKNNDMELLLAYWLKLKPPRSNKAAPKLPPNMHAGQDNSAEFTH